MNGAITEPLLSTTKPPKTAIMKIIGISQNFLRARRNDHNSSKNDMVPRQNCFFIALVAGADGSRAIQ